MPNTRPFLLGEMNKPIWWLPSLALFLFLGSFLDIFIDGQKIFQDSATPRHLATGEWILRERTIPKVNPFGYAQSPLPWVDYEWGFDILFATLKNCGGLGLSAFFGYFLFSAILLILYRSLVRAGVSLASSCLLIVVAYATLHVHFLLRPLLFSYLFFPLVVEVWFFRPVPVKWDWLFLPVIFLAWANLHAGWMAGLLFLGLSWMGRFFDRLSGKVNGEEAPLIPWIGLGLLCGLATLINPIGYHLHIALWHANAMKTSIFWQEYQSPDFNGLSGLACSLLIILTIVLSGRVLTKSQSWTVEWLLPFLVFLYLSLKAQRHTLFLIELALIPLARDVDLILFQSMRSRRVLPYWLQRMDSFNLRQGRAGGDIWLALVGASLIACFWLNSKPALKLKADAGKFFPALIVFLHEHANELKHPFTTSVTGGPLMLFLWPEIKISFDDRGEIYGDAGVYQSVRFLETQPGWREEFNQQDYDSAIMEDGTCLGYALAHEPGWTEAYSDRGIVVFIKKN